MKPFVFTDYVRATMGGAKNVADDSRLSPEQVERVAAYLKSPGSGVDATSSYESYLVDNMAVHPPRLPPGVDYVGFSGVDSAGKSNYTNAVEYTKELGGGGKAGIIGDTPWGKFIDKTSAQPEFDVMERKFKTFLAQEGIKPYGDDVGGAMKDMMWNAGSSPYLENAMKSGRPFVAFVENAPVARGFSTFELPTAQQFPHAVANGYPMRTFGPDPLTFASKSAGEFQQLEKSLAESATSHSGHVVSVGDLRSRVYVASGYDAVNRSIFGQPLTEFRQLNADQMSSVSKAWSAQEAARLTQPHPVEPAERARSPAMEREPARGPPGAGVVKPAEVEAGTHARTGTTALDGEAAAATRAGPSLAAKGLGAVGAAAVVYDGVTTASRTSDLMHAGNVTGGQSEVVHFAGRNLGMLAGAEVVGGAAALAGVESGPGLFVAGAIGGVAGAIGGDKIANAIDNHRIYNQTDNQGTRWHYNPDHAQQGWTRADYSVKAGADGMPYVDRQQRTADAAQANTLNYKASNTAVDLALAHNNTPRDPYSQPAGAHDAHSIKEAAWVRDSQSRTWSRQVTDHMIEHGMSVSHVEKASPARAEQLEQAARATIAANLADSPKGIAQHYLEAYQRNGWHAQGPVPDSVTHALKQPDNIRDASDGHTYTRGNDGLWRTPGMIWGTNEAAGNVRNELNATYTASQQANRPKAAEPSVAVPHAQAPHVLLNQEGHPDHALFVQAQKQVHALDAKHRHVPDQGSENLAASAAVAAKEAGLRKIDTLMLNSDGSKVFVAEAVVPNAVNRTASVSTMEAMQTSIEQSTQKMAQVNAQLGQHAQAQAHQQQTQQTGQGGPGR